jgi:heme/copper-type cytochrome/quinol oxidase subunit 4
VPFGWQWGMALPGGDDMELATGQTLFVLAILVLAVVGLMWFLAATRRSPR